MQAGIFSLVNNTHDATTQLLDDAVVGKFSPNEGIQGFGLVRHGKFSFPFAF
jgi:hypothetical protein